MHLQDGESNREDMPDASQDPVVRWGRRVGRALGYIFVALLIVNLFTLWFF